MEKELKQKRVKNIQRSPVALTKRFLVKTKGYVETFDTLEAARAQKDILRKRAIKSQEPVKIQILEKDDKKQVVIDEVSISDGYFD